MKTQTTEWTPERINLANALRDYETAHATWMNTPVDTAAGKRAKAALDVTREAYLKAMKALHPEWIIF